MAGIDSYDVGALERAVNDSAVRVSGIWLSFVAFTAYLAAAASMITHRQIFLEEPIKLPTINIDLPLVASAILLPLLFVIYHAYVLLQVVLLARTAQAYNDALDHNAPDAADNARLRQRLPNTMFAQLFAGSPRERTGYLGGLLRAMVWITLAIAPVCVLLLFQLKFLPYHGHLITWIHRALILLDVLVILLLWAGAIDARRDIALRPALRNWKSAAAGGVAILVSLLALTFPVEAHRLWMLNLYSKKLGTCFLSQNAVLNALWSMDRLSVSGETLIDPAKVEKIDAVAKAKDKPAHEAERTRRFNDRDFSCASLAGSDIRLADFTGATLNEANLDGANLQGARLAKANLRNAQLSGADLRGAQLDDADLRNAFLRGANLQDASMRLVNMQDARLDGATLQRAIILEARLDRVRMDGARMEGAVLTNTNLSSASLGDTRMQGAVLGGAQLQNSWLANAEMQGAWLVSANLQGAVLQQANLQGAYLGAALLQSAVLDRASLHGANMGGADFSGASMRGAQLQGALLEDTNFKLAYMPKVFVWGSTMVRCDGARLIAPVFGQKTGRWQYGDEDEPSVIGELAVGAMIESTVRDIPEKSEHNNSREKVRKDLVRQLIDFWKPERLAGFEQDWRDCAAQAQTVTNEDYAKQLVAYLSSFACEVDADYPAAAMAVYTNWIQRTEPVGLDKPTLARALLGIGKPCPGAEKLGDYVKKELRDLAGR